MTHRRVPPISLLDTFVVEFGRVSPQTRGAGDHTNNRTQAMHTGTYHHRHGYFVLDSLSPYPDEVDHSINERRQFLQAHRLVCCVRFLFHRSLGGVVRFERG